MLRRLYLRIWFAFLAILLAFAMLVGAIWWLVPDERDGGRFAEGFPQLVAEAIGPLSRPPRDVQATLARLTVRFRGQVTVLAPDGVTIAAVGPPLPPPRRPLRPGVVETRGPGRVLALRLEDGRTVLVRAHQRPPRHGPLIALVVVLVATAAGALLAARQITRRLERLRARVDALGQGDLASRVAVEGRDEVARLAESFNEAAARIEGLVTAHRSLLANVSHELRAPLSRIRMALELTEAPDRTDLRAQLARDIRELDDLIGELLVSSRLDAEAPITREEVDMLALCVEEGAVFDAQVRGEAVFAEIDERLMRRLVRNLLQNAQRYGAGSSIEVSVTAGEGRFELRVADRGPGVPDTERERIFEPFYRPRGSAETGQGFGLGLALVRQIARRHGGDAVCRPREGGGSVFEVRIPMACGDARASR